MSEKREQQTRKTDRTQRMTGLLIVGVVIMAAISLLAGLNKKLFGPEEGPFQESDVVVKMEVDTPVPDEAGDASRPADNGVSSDSLNAPVPEEVAAAVAGESGAEMVTETIEAEAVQEPSAPSAPLNAGVEKTVSTGEATSSAAATSVPVKKPAATRPVVQPAPVESVKKAPKAKKYMGRVNALDFNSDFSTFTMSVKTSRPVDQVTWFPVKNPRKVAVDIRGAWRPGVKPLYRFDEGVVDKVIMGEHPDRIRIVLWLRTPKGKKIGEPKIVKTPTGVEVTVTD